MDKNYSWMQIHPEGKSYALYLYNKSGIAKKVFQSRDLEAVQNVMDRRNKFKAKIQIALESAIQKAMTDPEALKRLQKKG